MENKKKNDVVVPSADKIEVFPNEFVSSEGFGEILIRQSSSVMEEAVILIPIAYAEAVAEAIINAKREYMEGKK